MAVARVGAEWRSVGVGPHDFYSLYFPRGVLLEAGLMARALNADEASKPRRVVQVFHAGDVREAAAAALHGALAGSDVQTAERSFMSGFLGGLDRAPLPAGARTE